MDTAGQISRIGNTYHQVRAHGDAGKPDDTNQKTQPPRPVDRVTLSREALSRYSACQDNSGPLKSEQDLSPDEKKVVNNLKHRDAEVKTHEASHMAAGGGVVQGGASYQYQSGPDGKMYAVGGEVQIDTSPAGSPEATIRKMQQIRRAALAPSQPSGTDRAVAAQASQVETQARMEKIQEATEKTDAPDALKGQPHQQEMRPAAASIGSRIDYRA
jgi:hypothetical protein